MFNYKVTVRKYGLGRYERTTKVTKKSLPGYVKALLEDFKDFDDIVIHRTMW